MEEGEIEAFLFDDEEVEAGAADTVSTSTFIAYRDMVRRYVNAISANEGVNERIVLEQLDLIVARRLQIESNYASIAGEEDFELSIIEPPRTQMLWASSHGKPKPLVAQLKLAVPTADLCQQQKKKPIRLF